MHELSLCQQLARVVSRASDGRRVVSVDVQVGHLRQVVPDALAYAWQFTIKGTPLADAELNIEAVPAQLRCLDCGAVSTVAELLSFDCSRCHSPNTRVIAGEEFRVTSIEVDDNPLSPPVETPTTESPKGI